MRVEVRLYATLADQAPTRRAGDPFDVGLDQSDSVSDLIRKLEIPEAAVHLVIVNGRPIQDRGQRLSHRDRVALFPPVGGG